MIRRDVLIYLYIFIHIYTHIYTYIMYSIVLYSRLYIIVWWATVFLAIWGQSEANQIIRNLLTPRGSPYAIPVTATSVTRIYRYIHIYMYIFARFINSITEGVLYDITLTLIYYIHIYSSISQIWLIISRPRNWIIWVIVFYI